MRHRSSAYSTSHKYNSRMICKSISPLSGCNDNLGISNACLFYGAIHSYLCIFASLSFYHARLKFITTVLISLLTVLTCLRTGCREMCQAVDRQEPKKPHDTAHDWLGARPLAALSIPAAAACVPRPRHRHHLKHRYGSRE